MLGVSGSGARLSATGGGASNGGNGVYDEAWTHQAQARAILGNLIGPNGEQLTSTDPYNTTVSYATLAVVLVKLMYSARVVQVFVGGLSPLISEETLRTFFAPFGDIHYVRFLLIYTL